jgi:hypothetical protein
MKIKPLKPLKRRLVIDGENWSWNCKNSHVVIRNTYSTWHTSKEELFGVTWDLIDRADHKGYGYIYAITPRIIAKYIKEIR